MKQSLLIFFAAFFISPFANATEVLVSIKGLGSNLGEVDISIFDSSETYLQDGRSLEGVCNDEEISIQNNQAEVLCQLNPGSYAIFVYHDDNRNGELDTTSEGAPLEGVGFSNNAEIRFDGPPEYYEAEIIVGSEKLNIVLNIQFY